MTPKIAPLRLPLLIKVLLVIIVLANVLITAAAGMQFGFTHDDLMNGHRAMTTPYPSLLLYVGEIWRVSPVYRPTSLLVIKTMYSAYGMNVTGWKIVYGALLLLMSVVTLAVVWNLSGSFLAGSVAAQIIGYHLSLNSLYAGMGLIFDVLAYILTGAFLITYLRARTGNQRSAYLYSASSIVFFWLAVQAKEIATVGAVFVIVYEVLSEPPTLSGLGEWFKQRALLWIILGISLVFSVAQLLSSGSLTASEAYRPVFSLSTYVAHVAEWSRMIALVPVPSIALYIASLAGILALVLWWRLSLWCVICLFIGIMPVALIPQRDVAAITVPLLAGLTFIGLSVEALCSGSAWVLARASILSARTARTVAIGMALAVSALILVWQGGPEQRMVGWAFSPNDLAIMPALSALRTLPPPQPGDSFVIDNDPFAASEWSDAFLFRLYYHLPELEVKRRNQVTAQELSVGRWRNLTWENNRWKELSQTR